ncbi:MAG TPA: asparaginase, partial [Acidobacteria bacterium]|nr:asparaginase [Acidobacteriota bacterium]
MGNRTKINRRDFVLAGAAGLAAAAPRPAYGRAPAVQTSVRPLVIASGASNSRNADGLNCVERAFSMITSGEDVLDAVVEGVTIVEEDPDTGGVGFGGTPNADGIVQLDACCMHGPTKRAGGVGGLEGVKQAAKVAQAVLEHTDHHLLVGDGAQSFARNMGFEVHDDLNTERSRERWLEW